jgi:hypothetical protein
MAFWHDEQRLESDFILPNPLPEIQTWGERLRLVTCLALDRDDASTRQLGVGTHQCEFLGDESNFVLRNDHHP